MEQYGSPVAAAAIMGNAWGESSMVPYRLSNDVEPDKNGVFVMSKSYAERVDSGEISRDSFIYAMAGFDSFGLFAWYGPVSKAGLYDYAKECGKSISDWKMQLDYVYKEITDRYYTLYSILLTETDVKKATNSFTMRYEKAVNYDIYSGKRVAKAKEYYNRYYSGEWTPENSFDDMLPIDGSYDYLDSVTLERCDKICNIYAYMLQRGLASAGYLAQTKEMEGYFSKTTEDAVKQLQRDYGLEETGIVSSAEWGILADQNGIG